MTENHNLLRTKNWSYSLAGVSFLVLLTVLQIWRDNWVFHTSLALVIISLPAWLLVAMTIEHCFYKGITTHEYYHRFLSKRLLNVSIVAGASLWGSIAVLVASFNGWLAGLFVFLSVAALTYVVKVLDAASKIQLEQIKTNK